MNLASTIRILAGGSGSGPTAPCPQCGPHGKTTQYREGDKVRILKPLRIYNDKTSNFKTIQPGKVGKVELVLPAIGHNSEMIKIKFGRNFTEEYVPTGDVEFHRIAGKPLDPGGGKRQIKSKPLDEKDAQMKVKIPTGGRYGLVKPDEGPRDSRGVTNFENRAHPMKGQYEEIDKVTGFSDTQAHPDQNLRTFIYEAKDADTGKGSVVWVHRYSDDKTGKVKQTVIGEVNYKDSNFRYSAPKQFTYKNPALAFKTLRDRYGIQMKLKDWKYR